MVLISISLLISDVKHLLMFILVVYISSLENAQYIQFFCSFFLPNFLFYYHRSNITHSYPFFNQVACFFLMLSYMSCLYTLDINSLLVISLLQIILKSLSIIVLSIYPLGYI